MFISNQFDVLMPVITKWLQKRRNTFGYMKTRELFFVTQARIGDATGTL
jgi:hypothetical protein